MFNLYFVHGWGFEESFWLPVGKILEGGERDARVDQGGGGQLLVCAPHDTASGRARGARCTD